MVSNTFSNCGLTRLFGHTLDRNNGLAGGVWVRYWADGWEGAWAESSWNDRGAFAGDEHNWDGTLKSYPEKNVWHVCVVDSQGSKNCLSNTVDAATGYDCNTEIQIVHITFKQN